MSCESWDQALGCGIIVLGSGVGVWRFVLTGTVANTIAQATIVRNPILRQEGFVHFCCAYASGTCVCVQMLYDSDMLVIACAL